MTKPGSSKRRRRHNALGSAVVGIPPPVAGPGVCYSDLHVQGDIPQTSRLFFPLGKHFIFKNAFRKQEQQLVVMAATLGSLECQVPRVT